MGDSDGFTTSGNISSQTVREVTLQGEEWRFLGSMSNFLAIFENNLYFFVRFKKIRHSVF